MPRPRDVSVRFEALEAGKEFSRKVTLGVRKNCGEGLCAGAVVGRQEGRKVSRAGMAQKQRSGRGGSGRRIVVRWSKSVLFFDLLVIVVLHLVRGQEFGFSMGFYIGA